MKKRIKLISLITSLMLIEFSITGCKTLESKKDHSKSGLFPYITEGFDKNYLLEELQDERGNLLKYKF